MVYLLARPPLWPAAHLFHGSIIRRLRRNVNTFFQLFQNIFLHIGLHITDTPAAPIYAPRAYFSENKKPPESVDFKRFPLVRPVRFERMAFRVGGWMALEM